MRRALGSGQMAVLLNSHSGILDNQTTVGEMRTACTTGGRESGMMHLAQNHSASYAARRRVQVEEKLDQGALGMSDPCGPLQLVLEPNSVSSINYLLFNLTFTLVLIDLFSRVKW